MQGFVIPDFHRIRRDVDRLERLLDLLDGSDNPVESTRPPVVAHWFRLPRGGFRIFRSTTVRDLSGDCLFAIETSGRRMHDGLRFWHLGPPSPTNDNTPHRPEL